MGLPGSYRRRSSLPGSQRPDRGSAQSLTPGVRRASRVDRGTGTGTNPSPSAV